MLVGFANYSSQIHLKSPGKSFVLLYFFEVFLLLVTSDLYQTFFINSSSTIQFGTQNRSHLILINGGLLSLKIPILFMVVCCIFLQSLHQSYSQETVVWVSRRQFYL